MLYIVDLWAILVAVAEYQSHIIRLDVGLARRARAFLAAAPGYADLSEFVAVSVENQLALETSSGGPDGAVVPSSGDTDAVAPGQDGGTIRPLRMPERQPAVLTEPVGDQPALFSFTNRLFPIKVATRALANTGEGASLPSFHEAAAAAARALGARLRAEDNRARRKGTERRWIALPVGDDQEAALNRYIHHFTATLTTDGRLVGPLVQLGLAGLDEAGLLLPTESGAQLAMAENPLLDTPGEADGVLSEEERDLFLAAIRANVSEAGEVREFVQLVHDHAGRQADVDASLGARHDGWSNAQAVAQRAAMVGRLHDLGLVEVEGRGPTARIRLVPDIDSYWEE
jgi:hypothetical protein